jgi:5,10-methylenetetrahydromethanopterin reductase
VPILIGATGDQMMEMTGEIADGVVLNYCVPPAYNDRALELLERGARKAGRSLEALDRPQLVVCSVDHSHEKAIDSTRMLLCQYLAQQPHIAKASGVSEEVVRQIQAILGWPATKEQINQAKHLVPEDLIEHITASGTPEEARIKVAEYRKRGCTCPILYPVGGDVRLLIDTFAQ